MIVFTAPSGAGKTTIVRHLLQRMDNIGFSVSATNRPKRPGEVDGEDYYFFSTDEFVELIEQGRLAEWQEVYDKQYYGTLRREIERIWKEGKHIVFDVDVKGAMRLKELYKDRCLVVFVKPPSIEVLLDRLVKRKTESQEQLRKRIRRAKIEMTYESQCDAVILNDDLETAVRRSKELVEDFL